MNNLKKLYEKVVNSNIINFDEYFYINFFVTYSEGLLYISNENKNNYDEIHIKCRKLSYDNWSFLSSINNLQDRENMLLIFSLVEANICEINMENNIISFKSLKDFLMLNNNIIKYIIDKINEQYYSEKEEYYKYELAKDFTRLYNSEKGVILEHKEISDYLVLSAFWEKLGLNYFDIKKLPYDVYKQLNLMMNIETEVKNNSIRESVKANKTKNHVANRRGR